VVAPLVRDGLYDGSQSVTTTVNGDGTVTTTTSYDNRVYNAATAAIAMLAGGALAGALGRDATAAAGAAQNEALNNAMSAKTRTLMNRAYSFEGQPASALNAADIRQTILELNVAAQDPNLTVQERNWLHNAALNAYIAGGQAGVLPVGDLGLTYNALISSMGFSGGGVASLPSGRAQDNVLSTTTGSRTAVTLGGDKSSNVGFDTSNLESKLSGYLLVAAHPQNQTKANWFSQALGFDRSNWQDLASQLRFDPATAVATKTTQYGKTYEQVIPITGANGKTINTTFVFMRDNSGTVRFVTGIPTKK
jgi:filamentous hemagglutinin